jgi:allantoicase
MKENLLLPGRGKDMGDGWETARSRGRNHVDWSIIRLGAPGMIERIVVDTAHFRGNFPQKVRVQGLCWINQEEPADSTNGWVDLIEACKCSPDKEHELPCLIQDKAFSHVKLIIIPDGGVKRLRVWGKRHME